MTRSSRTVAGPDTRNPHGPNCLALLITGLAVGVLYFNFDPTPVGAESKTERRGIEAFTNAMSVAPPPLPTAVDESKTGEGDAAPQATSNPNVLTGRMALLLNLTMVENGCLRLEKVTDYTATFFKQERIGAELTDGQVMSLKIRHAPFSVYMKWLVGDKGRELLYVTGQNDGEMIVHPGGWKARLLPAIKLDPLGSLAMKESRHPVTQVGLLELSRLIAEFRKRDLSQESGVSCRVTANQKFQDRDCYCFEVEYASPKIRPEYRKSIMYLDAELSIPIVVKNFGWPQDVPGADPENLDESTLVEHYAYSDITLEQRLADRDFDTANADYKFRR